MRKRARLVAKVKTALAELTPEEAAELFREAGRCACSDLARLTKAAGPVASTGALLGGLAGLVLDLSQQVKK